MRCHEYKGPLIAGADPRRKLLAELGDHKAVVHDGRKEQGSDTDSLQQTHVPRARAKGDKTCSAGYRSLYRTDTGQQRAPQVRHQQRSDVLRSGCRTGGLDYVADPEHRIDRLWQHASTPKKLLGPEPMEQGLRRLRARGAVVLNRSQQLVVVVQEPDVHTPPGHTHAVCGTIKPGGGALQTNNSLCKKLFSVPMLFPAESRWLVAEPVHLVHLEATAVQSSHNDSAARGTKIHRHIAAQL